MSGAYNPFGPTYASGPIPGCEAGAQGCDEEATVAEAPTVSEAPKDASTAPPGGDPDSILVEAQNLVHGPRQASYGHPADDFQRTADLLNVLSKRGRAWLPSDVALVMMCVKLSRQANAYKRDNLVDLCGYTECWARIVEGR